jgi:very-short-patch-repair endonuclease
MELPLESVGPMKTRERVGRAIKRSRNERFERELALQIRAHRLPEPHEQYRWALEAQSPTGKPRQFRADFAWPAREYRLLVEVQGGIFMRGGGGHSHPIHIVKDIEKQQVATLLGWFVLPVTTDEVKRGDAIAQLERFFASRGWKR